MTERTRLISYVLYGLFINDLNLRSMKTNNWSADTLKKKHVTSMSCTLEPAIQPDGTGQRIPFWQLLIGHEMDVHQIVHCLGHLDRNTRSLLENSQSQPAYYCSHTIKWHIGIFLGVRERNRGWGTACFSSPPFPSSPSPSTLEKPDALAALQCNWKKW